MWFSVYQDSDGRLVSTGSDEPIGLSSGLSYKSVGSDRPTGVWNATTLVFDPAPVPDRIVSKLDFIERFTDVELRGILNAAKTDARVALFLKKIDLAGEINLDGQRTIAALNGLATLGHITAGRSGVILNG